jgi:23S rRNA pseudouridine1911/1915/1917 synthase
MDSGGERLRLDVFLARHVPGCSRRSAQQAIAAGAVRVNGRRARKGQMVAGNDVVEVRDNFPAPRVIQANPQLVIPVLYEDTAVIALDKPAGMPSHALRTDETATVANFLLAYHPELIAVGKPGEAGVVHRLDTDTSGVLLAARTQDAYDDLRQQFASHHVRKEYLAVVAGDVSAAGVVRAPIAHSRHNRRKMRVSSPVNPDARAALTHYRPLERWRDATLLAVHIPTGVMHQIRVHLASIGHPVLGDRLYGMPAAAQLPAKRHMLHASGLGFTHPETGQAVSVSSPLPDDFREVLDAVRAP